MTWRFPGRGRGATLPFICHCILLRMYVGDTFFPRSGSRTVTCAGLACVRPATIQNLPFGLDCGRNRLIGSYYGGVRFFGERCHERIEVVHPLLL